MSDSTVVLITGVSRGIGRALVQTYLLRPNHVVVGSVRDIASSSAQELKALPAAAGSRLLVVKVENSSPTDPADAVKNLEAAGINHLDIVIANAGGSGGRTLSPLDIVAKQDVTKFFNVNALGPLILFQSVKLLLEKSRSPVWVAIGSGAASIGSMKTFGTHVVPANGIAKAALNWITMAAHCDNKWPTAFVIHPGFVQTDGGNAAARDFGMEKAMHTMEQSINGITNLLDQATRKKSSGKFYNAIDGTEIPW